MMRVFVEVGIDEIHSFVLRRVIGLALFSRKLRRDNLAASVKACSDDVRTFFDAETDKGLHHRHCPCAPLLQSRISRLRKTAILDNYMVASASALEHLNCSVMGTGKLLHQDWNIDQ